MTLLQVPNTAVALGVIHCEVAPSHMFYAINASLVGLCCLAEKVTSKGGPVILSQATLCPCVGFGMFSILTFYIQCHSVFDKLKEVEGLGCALNVCHVFQVFFEVLTQHEVCTSC